jgi:hypothetical protein
LPGFSGAAAQDLFGTVTPKFGNFLARTEVHTMTIRTRKETVVFTRPFYIKGVDRTLPEGTYEIIGEDELIEGLSFPCYRRVGTFIMAPGAPPSQSSKELIEISPLDLADAQRIDGTACAGTKR